MMNDTYGCSLASRLNVLEPENPDEPGELDSIRLDVHDIPTEVVEKFISLPIEELNRLAWTATRWSPGTLERQLVYQLRATFEVNFKRPMGWGINHAADNPNGGTGTLPEPRCLDNLRKPGRRSQRPQDASADGTITESCEEEIGDCG